ncbi:hypothetical protein CRE_19176 [Caenorhabditis remanei]|uniref:Uncharacterized protein n=2 Tax=Caenorhabditis remanei TaxID=31234 RepID=E3MJP9_CAERE|nr:hypothetical protein CRE_19176 [Caenorhabditis remanei]
MADSAGQAAPELGENGENVKDVVAAEEPAPKNKLADDVLKPTEAELLNPRIISPGNMTRAHHDIPCSIHSRFILEPGEAVYIKIQRKAFREIPGIKAWLEMRYMNAPRSGDVDKDWFIPSWGHTPATRSLKVKYSH